MSKVITFQHCGMMLDALYRNAMKDKLRQRSLAQLSKDCEVSVTSMTKLRDILIDSKLLIKEGNNRGQRIFWHPDKTSPNPSMQQKIYNMYIRDAKRQDKVSVTHHRGRVSLDAALKALVQLGFTGEIRRTVKISNGIKTVEYVNLGEIKVED